MEEAPDVIANLSQKLDRYAAAQWAPSVEMTDLWWSKNAGLSTALRFGRDDTSVGVRDLVSPQRS
jgi:hypothetical protein